MAVHSSRKWGNAPLIISSVLSIASHGSQWAQHPQQTLLLHSPVHETLAPRSYLQTATAAEELRGNLEAERAAVVAYQHAVHEDLLEPWQVRSVDVQVHQLAIGSRMVPLWGNCMHLGWCQPRIRGVWPAAPHMAQSARVFPALIPVVVQEAMGLVAAWPWTTDSLAMVNCLAGTPPHARPAHMPWLQHQALRHITGRTHTTVQIGAPQPEAMRSSRSGRALADATSRGTGKSGLTSSLGPIASSCISCPSARI